MSGEVLITESEARVITCRFLLSKYPSAKIEVHNIELIAKEDNPVYLVKGKLIRRSQNFLDRFLFPIPPNQYSFKVELNAIKKKILYYEFH